MAAILAEHPRGHGVIHSFTAGPAEAERYLDLGWHLGFNGVATFRNAPEVREAARLAPRDRILIETDSPYLAPVPHRGKRCEPAYVAHTLACLALVRECDPAELAAATTRNARRLFGLGRGRRSQGTELRVPVISGAHPSFRSRPSSIAPRRQWAANSLPRGQPSSFNDPEGRGSGPLPPAGPTRRGDGPGGSASRHSVRRGPARP